MGMMLARPPPLVMNNGSTWQKASLL